MLITLENPRLISLVERYLQHSRSDERPRYHKSGSAYIHTIDDPPLPNPFYNPPRYCPEIPLCEEPKDFRPEKREWHWHWRKSGGKKQRDGSGNVGGKEGESSAVVEVETKGVVEGEGVNEVTVAVGDRKDVSGTVDKEKEKNANADETKS